MTDTEIIREMKIFLLYLFRISSLILVLPIFGLRGKMKLAKVGLALATTVLIYAARYPSPLEWKGSGAYFLLAAQSVGTGIFLGFSVYLAIYGLKMAGSLVGLEMGLNFARQADPTTGESVPLMGNFYEIIILLVLLSLDGHHWILQMLNRSFDVLPVSRLFFHGCTVAWLFYLLGIVFEISVSMVAPIFIILFLITVGVGLIAKNIPQINILEVGFPLRILVGIGMLSLFLPHLSKILASVFYFFQEKLFALFSFL